MNITEAVRSYILENPDQIIDAAFLHRALFPIVNWRTFLKILSRLNGSGAIRSIGRGIYAPASISERNISDRVCAFYCEHGSGMIVGSALFYELGLIKTSSKEITIYTNRLENNVAKNVLEYRLIGADIVFDAEAKNLITLLELIEHKDYLIPVDNSKYAEIVQRLSSEEFSLELFEEVKNSTTYEASTLTTVERLQ